MSDKFIDDLFNELQQHKAEQLTEAAKQADIRSKASEARRLWFDAFVERIGQLVGAWNEKAGAAARLAFEKRENGRVYVSHQRVEAELWVENEYVVGTRRLDSAGSSKENLIPLPVDQVGGIARAGDPAAAAEKFMRPIFERSFAVR